MATNYPTFQSDPTVNTLTASSGVTSSVGIFDKLYTPQFGVVSNTEFGVLEAGGPYGAYLDLKKPYSDDFDIRLMSDAQIEGGGYLLNAGGAILSLSGANVGIGTFAPSAKMYVHTAPQWSSNNYGANIVVGGNTRNNAIGLLDSTDSNPWAIANTGGKLQFSTMPPLGNTSSTPSQYVTFNNNGDVGVGVTAPPSKFSVAGSQGNANGITVTSVNVATIITHDPATNGGMIQVKSGGSSTSIGPNNYRLLLQPEGGNVGIGTTEPGAKISVKGEVSVSPLGTGEDIVYNGSFISTKPSTSNQHINIIRAGNHVRSIGYAPNSNTFLIAGGEANDFNFGNAIPFAIDNQGNVGIGTTSPSGKFSVSTGDSRKQLTVDLSADPVAKFGLPDWYNIGVLAFVNGSAGERMRIDSNGNVGIGTTIPEQKLQVGNETGQQIARIAGGDSGVNGGSALYLGAGSGLDIYALGHYSAINGGAYNDTLTLYAAGGRPVYMQCGNVGIGTTSPNYKLTVSGGLAGTATGVASFWTRGTTQGERSSLSLYSTFQTTADNVPRRTADVVAGFNGGAWGAEYLTFNVGNNGSSNDAQDLTAEKVRIQNNGNVGIGTTTPAYKLDVAGTGRFTSNVQITGTLTGITQLTASNISSSGDLFIGGKVGIGTSNVSLQGGGTGLAINGTSYTQVKLTGVGGAGIQLSGSRQYEINSDSGNAFFVLNRSIDNNAYRLIIRDNTVLFPTSSLSIGGAYDRVPAYTCDVTGSGRFTSTLVVSGGIQFPATQVPSADVNTLDDYEEGEWVPTIYSNVGSGFTYNTSLTSGSYVKIGRAVMLNGAIVLTSTGSASSTIYIANLPFSVPSGASNRYSATFGYYVNLAPSVPAPVGWGLSGTSYIAMYKSTSTGVTQMQVTDLTNITTIYFSMHYNV